MQFLAGVSYCLLSLGREFIVVVEAGLCIEWNNLNASSFSKDDDRVIFVVYNAGKGKFVTFQNASKRTDMEVQLQLPLNFQGIAAHCWVHYVSKKGDKVSTSLYLGQVGGQ